jgi:hypothetical protein
LEIYQNLNLVLLLKSELEILVILLLISNLRDFYLSLLSFLYYFDFSTKRNPNISFSLDNPQIHHDMYGVHLQDLRSVKLMKYQWYFVLSRVWEFVGRFIHGLGLYCVGSRLVAECIVIRRSLRLARILGSFLHRLMHGVLTIIRLFLHEIEVGPVLHSSFFVIVVKFIQF